MGTYGGPQIVTNGLILKLDAANKKSYPGSGTTWTDLSGNSNHGTLRSGPTFSTDKIGNLVFDGTNDWVDCGAIKPTGAMTISTWYKGNVHINTHTAGRGAIAGYALRSQTDTPNGRISLNFTIPVASATTVYISGWHTTDTSLWYNVVGVFIPSTSITIYLNGTNLFEHTDDIPAAQYVGNPSPTRINVDGSTNYEDGSVAEVSMYNIALTQAEITQNFNATKHRFI